MKAVTLYHGSNVEVSVSQIMINGFYKDFGYGFYLTNIEKQAKRWALTKRGASIVSIFSYTENPQNSDIVEGPMADDQIWDYVEDYMDGIITKAAFWELIKFKYPTHQIVFCTDKALKSLHFERSMTL